MKSAKFSKADSGVRRLNLIGIPPLLMYVFFMIIYPEYLAEEASWDHVQAVWDRWQTLNAAILAVIASFVALNITKYREAKLKEWRFTAARASLPLALSEMSAYLKASAALLVEVYKHIEQGKRNGMRPFENHVPSLPLSSINVFKSCIEPADPEVGEYMAQILKKLQIHHSRLEQLYSSFNIGSTTIHDKEYVKSVMFSLGELYAHVGNLYPFARAEADFDGSILQLDMYVNAYTLLGIECEDVEDLYEFTERAVDRQALANRSWLKRESMKLFERVKKLWGQVPPKAA